MLLQLPPKDFRVVDVNFICDAFYATDASHANDEMPPNKRSHHRY